MGCVAKKWFSILGQKGCSLKFCVMMWRPVYFHTDLNWTSSPPISMSTQHTYSASSRGSEGQGVILYCLNSIPLASYAEGKERHLIFTKKPLCDLSKTLGGGTPCASKHALSFEITSFVFFLHLFCSDCTRIFAHLIIWDEKRSTLFFSTTDRVINLWMRVKRLLHITLPFLWKELQFHHGTGEWRFILPQRQEILNEQYSIYVEKQLLHSSQRREESDRLLLQVGILQLERWRMMSYRRWQKIIIIQ